MSISLCWMSSSSTGYTSTFWMLDSSTTWKEGRMHTQVYPPNTHMDTGTTTFEIRGTSTQTNTHGIDTCTRLCEGSTHRRANAGDTARYRLMTWERRRGQTQVYGYSIREHTGLDTHPGPMEAFLLRSPPYKSHPPAPSPPTIPCVQWEAGHALDHTS